MGMTKKIFAIALITLLAAASVYVYSLSSSSTSPLTNWTASEKKIAPVTPHIRGIPDEWGSSKLTLQKPPADANVTSSISSQAGTTTHGNNQSSRVKDVPQIPGYYDTRISMPPGLAGEWTSSPISMADVAEQRQRLARGEVLYVPPVYKQTESENN